MWHEWEAIRGQAGGAGGSHRACPAYGCLLSTLAHIGTVKEMESKMVISLENLSVWCCWRGNTKLKTLKKFKYYEAVSASAACWIRDGEQQKEASVYVCVCVMWKTNEHCNVGYQPSPALLFLRANPAASPPLPPPPQPPQKLYNGELLSLCYLTPTTHYALPAWWETEEQRREEEEWEHRRPREEKVGWYQLKLAMSEEKEKKKEKVCAIFHIVVLLL